MQKRRGVPGSRESIGASIKLRSLELHKVLRTSGTRKKFPSASPVFCQLETCSQGPMYRVIQLVRKLGARVRQPPATSGLSGVCSVLPVSYDCNTWTPNLVERSPEFVHHTLFWELVT